MIRFRNLAVMIAALALCLTSGIGVSSQNAYRSAVIVISDEATGVEVHSAEELARDMEKVYDFLPEVVSENSFNGAKSGQAVFYVGKPGGHHKIEKYVEKGLIEVSADDPGPEAFIIRSFPQKGEVIIAGCDDRGVLYGVYEYSTRILGIDPMEYWTGKKAEKRDAVVLPDMNLRKDPPAFPLRGYFDNDSDMLANFKGDKLIIEFDLWKEIIDSSARLGYNFFDLFDTMGRTEFWVWDYYKKMVPDYKADLELINQVMDYAHEKGLMIQVSTYLGYEFHHLPYEEKCLSDHYDKWVEAYRYLLDETPVGKADIIYQSPRDPWWDRPYYCAKEIALGIDSSELHSDLLNDLKDMVYERNPDAIMIGLLWADGKEHWDDEGFTPDKDVTMVWSDDGYGRYPTWPEDFKGNEFGIYIHAGFYRNHVIQDPYPRRIKDSVMEAYDRDMTAYYFVNGQDFKHFILNLEACALAAWDPEGFDPDAFYEEWTSRYFGEQASPIIIESLKDLHEAHNLSRGGFAHLNVENYIAAQMAKAGIPYVRDRSYMQPALELARHSLELAEQARPLVPKDMLSAYDDQILFPAKIYLANFELHESVMAIIDWRSAFISPHMTFEERLKAPKNALHHKKIAMDRLHRLKDLLNEGSGWDKWEGWTRVENFRKYQPPISEKELKWLIWMY